MQVFPSAKSHSVYPPLFASGAQFLAIASMFAAAALSAQSTPAPQPTSPPTQAIKIQNGTAQPASTQAAPTQAIPVAPVPTQPGVNQAGPIAIVPLDSKDPGSASMVTGALQVVGGKAIIASSGAITSGVNTTEILLPHRGTLRVCASTTVKLAADASVPKSEVPGLMMVLDHGAVEASFATGRNSDILLTPDFRILIGGPGAADVKVRLAQHGDTCIDNAGINAPYVLVTSVFDGAIYRVQPGQRVMFQHGSLHEVVDQEKEPCGCPEPPRPGTNEFPVAQSAGLLPPPPPGPPGVSIGSTDTFVYNGNGKGADEATLAPPPPPLPTVSANRPIKQRHSSAMKKPTFLTRVGHFFRRLFGAE